MARGLGFSALVSFILLGCAGPGAPLPATAQAAPSPPPADQRTRQAGGSPPLGAPSSSAPSPLSVEISAPGATLELGTPGEAVALDVPGFSPAIVRFADRAGKAPVLVVTHGAGGTPEAHCELWARISRGRAMLLCVRGRARDLLPADGDYYPDHPTLERETFAALGALRARFAAGIADGPVYYAGFSQGATMGALMLVGHANEIPRLLLVEGGFAEWSLARARDFRAQGGERVLFVCGRKECADAARNAAHWFNQAGVAAQVEYVRGAGHSHGARVETRIAALYPWFVEGDDRWQRD